MAKAARKSRTFDALPDTIDFRDKMYIPTLIHVAPTADLEKYRKLKIPVLDQGTEGACTGYGLATVVNFLLRSWGKAAEADEVSAKMLYVMAKRYDEWPGEDYDGSSARGAVKGWHKHGVCAAAIWDQTPQSLELDDIRSANALKRPLGAYFRVNHKDLVGMHSAITEVGILYATATVHEGWQNVKKGDKEIVYSPKALGGHAFAIVAYDEQGFWIQNSWGDDWGDKGLARISYADWLENGTDVWVARLGAPIQLVRPDAAARMNASAPRSYESYVFSQLRPHVVTAGNNGQLLSTGAYGLTDEGLKTLVRKTLPKIASGWGKKRVLLYAHGGLVPEESALQYVANHRQYALDSQIYPIAFIWRSDAWTTIKNILQDALTRRKNEGFLDAAKDFMLDRLDDTLEPVARLLGGKTLWDEMKENATLTSAEGSAADKTENGAAYKTAEHLIAASKAGEIDEIHLVGHSAGSILLAPLAQHFVDNNIKIASLTLWAPACTTDLFKQSYLKLIEDGDIQAFDLFTLDDPTERDDDCANIYNKSLLYLVSGAFEAKPRIPIARPNGTPLLGLARDVETEIDSALWDKPNCRHILSPTLGVSEARHHGDFDNDEATLVTSLKRVVTPTGPAQAAPKQVRAGRAVERALSPAIIMPPASPPAVPKGRRQKLDTLLKTAN